jgi:hypothetical protein
MSDEAPLIGETLSYIVQFLRAQGRYTETAPVSGNHTPPLLNTYQAQSTGLLGHIPPRDTGLSIGEQEFVPPIELAPSSRYAVVDGIPSPWRFKLECC